MDSFISKQVTTVFDRSFELYESINSTHVLTCTYMSYIFTMFVCRSLCRSLSIQSIQSTVVFVYVLIHRSGKNQPQYNDFIMRNV